MATREIKAIIAYDGTNYHGWAIQKEDVTVESTIIDSLTKLTDAEVTIYGTSRTDAGVHAKCQVAKIILDTKIPTESLREVINKYLPNDIVFTHVEDAPIGFNPFTGPIDKSYQYKIHTGKVRDVFEFGRCWNYTYPLDENLMQEASQKFVGTKDFRSFASARDSRPDSIRTIFECNVARNGEWVIINIRGNRFMYNMVRNMVGTLVEIGRGRWKPECIDEIIEAKDRQCAGILAPASGLFLMHINYGD